MYLILALLIDAYKNDFPLKDHEGFWDWLNLVASTFNIYIPEKVKEEIERKSDGLSEHLHTLTNLKKVPTRNATSFLKQVLEAYGTLDEHDLEKLDGKADPYVIAHALCLGAAVVTSEKPDSNPDKIKPSRKKIPDVCDNLEGVVCISYPRFLWQMHAIIQ